MKPILQYAAAVVVFALLACVTLAAVLLVARVPSKAPVTIELDYSPVIWDDCFTPYTLVQPLCAFRRL